jgi:hypothetical protein
VLGVGEPGLTRYGVWMSTRMPSAVVASRNCRSTTGSPSESAQPRGLPQNTCMASQPISTALLRAPATRFFPTRTWVPIGRLETTGSRVAKTRSVI